jgi:hypothetical protein
MGYAALTIKTATTASNTSALMHGIEIDAHSTGAFPSYTVIFNGLVDTSAFDRIRHGWVEVSGDVWDYFIGISKNPYSTWVGTTEYATSGAMPITTNVYMNNDLYDPAVTPDGWGLSYLKIYLRAASAASHVDHFSFNAFKRIVP